jgi:hypothetical protein
VTPAWLHDRAVVYSAHFTSYGALPATLHRCPGVCTRLCVTWLTATRLELMHRSEGAGERSRSRVTARSLGPAPI